MVFLDLLKNRPLQSSLLELFMYDVVGCQKRGNVAVGGAVVKAMVLRLPFARGVLECEKPESNRAILLMRIDKEDG